MTLASKEPILKITDGTTVVDLAGPRSGFYVEDPYWQPAVSLDGENVIDTIPLSVRGNKQEKAIQALSKLFELIRVSFDRFALESEYKTVWLEVKLPSQNALSAYSRIISINIPQLSNVFGQPFYSGSMNQAVLDGISLVVERQGFFRQQKPYELLGPFFNYAKNSDFELWSNGVVNSVPDSWTEVETLWIIGQIDRYDTPKFGRYCAKIRVSGSTLAGASKGITQVISGLKGNTTYTAICYVKSDGVSNGVGRVLVTYASQLELFNSSDRTDWTVKAATFTTGANDTVAVKAEILTDNANTDGTFYIDGVMILEGSYATDALNEVIPFISSSHITNHSSLSKYGVVTEGAVNYLDVWNVPGDLDSFVRLEVIPTTTISDYTDQVESLKTLRIGMRRTQDVFDFDNLLKLQGTVDSTAVNGHRIESITLSSAWADVATFFIPYTEHNQGRYRLIIRAYDNRAAGQPLLDVRLKYFIGTPEIDEKILPASPALRRGDWTVIDVTKDNAMIVDRHRAPNKPAQIGITVQMKRSAGAETAYIDYVMLIPTDGGWIETEFDSLLGINNAFIVDNTEEQNIVETIYPDYKYSIAYKTNDVPRSLAVYRNYLYVGCDGGELYRIKDRIGTQVGTYGAVTIRALEVYNGLLHVAYDTTLNTSNGQNFPSGSPIFSGAANITALKSFNGYLYIGLANGDIYRWDGSTSVLSHSTGQGSVEAFEFYKNRLYAATDTAALVYELNPTSGAWSISYTAPGGDASGFHSLATFLGKLYAGSTAQGKIYVYDGNTWAEIADLSDITTVTKLLEYNGIFYAFGTPASSVVTSTDGETWTQIHETSTQAVEDATIYEGVLFIAPQSKNISSLAINNAMYKVPEYAGNMFMSPKSSRHRYVFSFDRADFINNISDTLLVGIGFVPRYKSPRGNQ